MTRYCLMGLYPLDREMCLRVPGAGHDYCEDHERRLRVEYKQSPDHRAAMAEAHQARVEALKMVQGGWAKRGRKPKAQVA